MAPAPPAAVRALPPMASVDVIVTAASRGVAEVRLADGDTSFSLRTNLPSLPEGTRLSVQVIGQQTEATTLRVTEVGGRPLAAVLPELQTRTTGQRATLATTAMTQLPAAGTPTGVRPSTFYR